MQIELRVDPVRHHVECDGDDIEVSCTLAVSKEGAFDSVSSSQEPEFGGSDSCPAVVVGVQADECVLAVLEVPAEPLDLVCVNIGGGDLHSSREIQNDLFI